MNVFLPLRKLQTLLICSIFMNISLLALAADPSLLIKDLGEGHCLFGACQYYSEILVITGRRCIA